MKNTKSEGRKPKSEGEARLARIATETGTDCPYALRRGFGTWEVTFEGERDSFKEEQGAEYVVWLLMHPPLEPIHAADLALKARPALSGTPWAEGIQQRSLGLDDAEALRRLQQQVRELEAVQQDHQASEREKAEARKQRADIREFLRKNPWRNRDGAQKCIRSVSMAIKRLCDNLAEAVDAEGKPHPVLQAFAEHLYQYLLTPSGRGGGQGGVRGLAGGCFTYEPPDGVVWKRLEP
jgi:hypothetical protein